MKSLKMKKGEHKPVKDDRSAVETNFLIACFLRKIFMETFAQCNEPPSLETYLTFYVSYRVFCYFF